MKFLIGLLIGLALGYAAASLLSGRNELDEEIDWAASPSPTPANV
jgi:hypothetical protein